MAHLNEADRAIGTPTQICPVCGLTPDREHRRANGTLHTGTYTCVVGHIWQVRWTAAA